MVKKTLKPRNFYLFTNPTTTNRNPLTLPNPIRIPKSPYFSFFSNIIFTLSISIFHHNFSKIKLKLKCHSSNLFHITQFSSTFMLVHNPKNPDFKFSILTKFLHSIMKKKIFKSYEF